MRPEEGRLVQGKHPAFMASVAIRGRAEGVRHAVHVSGDRDRITTRHHAIFKIGETTVRFASGTPPVINEGDRVVVAGRIKGRVLHAYAYENETAGVRGDSGLWQNFAWMSFFLLLGAAGLGWWPLGPLVPQLPRLDKAYAALAAVAGAAFTAYGLYFLFRWTRIRGAVRLLKGT